jgi:hypothetical protein
MSNSTNEATGNTAEAAPEVAPVVIRDSNKVIGELKNAVGKLSRQEAKATESDKLAATFNNDIMDMASGKVPQTATRTIQSIATDQAKHVKRSAKIRETNGELAQEIRDLNEELSDMVTELLTPYPVAEADEIEGEVDNTEGAFDGEEAAE